MANYGAMTAFKKALQAPEDRFDFGSVFRTEDGDATVLVKLDDNLWIEVSRSGVDDDGVTAHVLNMNDVVETVRDSAAEWEVSHNWKDAKPGNKKGDLVDDDDEPGPPPFAKAKGRGKAKDENLD